MLGVFSLGMSLEGYYIDNNIPLKQDGMKIKWTFLWSVFFSFPENILIIDFGYACVGEIWTHGIIIIFLTKLIEIIF